MDPLNLLHLRLPCLTFNLALQGSASQEQRAKGIPRLLKQNCSFSLFSASDLYIYWAAVGCCGNSRGSYISLGFEKLGTKGGRKWLCVYIETTVLKKKRSVITLL